MPVFIAPLVGFILGIAFAWAAADEIAGDPTSALGTRSLVVGTLFSVLVFAPVAGYFLAFHGDWAFAYVVNASRLPSAVLLTLVMLDAVSVPAGYLVAATQARRRRLPQILSLAAVPTVLSAIVLLMLARRLGVSATYAQFHGDFGTQSVQGTALGYGLVWMNGVLAVAVALTIREIRRLAAASRRLRY